MNKLYVNQKISIKIDLEDGGEVVFQCKIKQVHSDRLTIKTTDEMMKYIDYLEEGKEVQATIFTPLGMILFSSMILNSVLEPEFVIEYTDENIQIQRREFLRVEHSSKLVLEFPSGENVMTHTLDLSAGGLRFYYEGKLKPEQVLDCRLYLPMQMDSILVQGKINQPKIVLPENQYLIIFTKINEEDIDRITKTCLELSQKKEDL